jgi:2-polyprenyl-3-methyl-5-hydroxy-6-metoxy-1,4-benzoquinol methylase
VQTPSPRSRSIRTRAQSSCPCCGGVGDVLYERLRDGVFSAPGEWSFRRCASPDCGLIWLDPVPLAEDLLLAYEGYYTHGHADSADNSGSFAKRAYRAAVNTFLAMGGIPAERRRVDLMFIGDKSPATLLDVGCGAGSFLAEMQTRGWRVAGVDFDEAAVRAATARGLDVRVGGIESVVASGATFDYVTASHVVEHVPSPGEFLLQCRRVLKPAGRIVLRTPNAESLGHRLYGAAWRGLEPPRHLHIFSVRALVAWAERAGLKVEACFTSAAHAEGILVASHFLHRDGEFRLGAGSTRIPSSARLLGPLFALRAKNHWWRDKSSGEEICAVLSEPDSARAA